MPVTTPGPRTQLLDGRIHLVRPELVVLNGQSRGRTFPVPPDAQLRIGSGDENDLVLPDIDAVHVELQVGEAGITVIDRSNGRTKLNGATVHEGVLEPGGTLDLDGIEVRLQDQAHVVDVLPSDRSAFGPAQGKSLAMREVFGVLEVVAPTTATVLLLGETGTGKDVLAQGIHASSGRSAEPICTLDCSAISPGLVEAELFGYERGAFTGAEDPRAGAFERAEGSTLFLDEIGELPLDVQPKLLRAIDEREIQRVGGIERRAIDVRIVAATKRDLAEEVARGRFRQDLYFRLAVVPLSLPPLRNRREDIPVLVEHFRTAFVERTGHDLTIPEEEVQGLLTHDWPGNVRELRNTVERALWMAITGDGEVRFLLPNFSGLIGAAEPIREPLDRFDPDLSFSEHKARWEATFEKHFLAWLMARADGSLSQASRLASMDRKHLRGLLRKHDLVPADAPKPR